MTLRPPFRPRLRAWHLILPFLDACSNGGNALPRSTEAIPCDVDRILQERCRDCHQEPPRFGAPMPLVTYADLLAPGRTDPARSIWELVKARIHDDARPMPPPPHARLGPDATAILDGWLTPAAAGSPPAPRAAEAGACPPAAHAPRPAELSCAPDLHLGPPRPYLVGRDIEDAYVCFGVDLTTQTKRHVTAFAPRIDNATVVHHMVLFQSDEPFSGEPKPCEFFGSTSWRIVAVWAPGTAPFELPPAAGLPFEGTAHYVVQLHYNNLRRLDGQADASGFDLCSTPELRPNDADVMAFGAASFTVPARGGLDLTCDFTAPPGFGEGRHLLGAMPHMHKIGTVLRTTLHAGDASAPIEVASRDPWNFETQYWSHLPSDTVVRPGDVVRTRCAWQNPSDTPVSFGEGTLDEMCFDFVLYYPRLPGARGSWALPAARATCNPTP